MLTQRKPFVGKGTQLIYIIYAGLFIVLGINSCTSSYLALDGLPPAPPVTTPAKLDTTGKNCPCPTAPGSSTTASPSQPTQVDTLSVQPPHFSPDGGTYYMNTDVKLTADSLPSGAVIEYSIDNGETWQTGSQFTLITGGKVLTRIRAGTRLSRSRTALFSLYFKRMLVIGNSIMAHGPAPELGWYNFNGMAASAPEKDFVHLLAGYLQQIYPATTFRLQAGTNLEQGFGTSNYSTNDFKQALDEFKPDLIIVRLGENVDDGQVLNRNFELYYRQLLDLLVSYNQPVRIVSTTSVWYKPNFDTVVRKVTPEKGHTLIDLGSMVGQAKCFASQYANAGVAAHPNDVGMRYIADMIWQKIQ